MEGLLERLHKIDFQGPVSLQGYGISGDERKNLERSMGDLRKLTEGLFRRDDELRL